MDERFYTFTSGVGLVEDEATASAQPEEETAARTLYVAGQQAAEGLGAALTWGGGTVRVRVATDAGAGTIEIGTVV